MVLQSLLSPSQAAAFLGIKTATLATWRSKARYALPFVKLGGRLVRYRAEDLQAFLEANRENSTKAQRGDGRVVSLSIHTGARP